MSEEYLGRASSCSSPNLVLASSWAFLSLYLCGRFPVMPPAWEFTCGLFFAVVAAIAFSERLFKKTPALGTVSEQDIHRLIHELETCPCCQYNSRFKPTYIPAKATADKCTYLVVSSLLSWRWGLQQGWQRARRSLSDPLLLGALRPLAVLAGQVAGRKVLPSLEQLVLYGPHVCLERSDNIVPCEASPRCWLFLLLFN